MTPYNRSSPATTWVRIGSMTRLLNLACSASSSEVYAAVSSLNASSGSSAIRSMPPGPETLARFALAASIAAWPALIELMDRCWPWPPNAYTPSPRPPTTMTSARIASAARRWVSRRDASGVTRR